MNRKRKIVLTAIILFISVIISSCGILQFRDENGQPVTQNNSEKSNLTEKISDTESNSDEPPLSITESETVETEPLKKSRLKFIAAGDNIIHQNIYIDAQNRAVDGAEYTFTGMYEDIATFVVDADIAFINQETPLAGEEFGYSGYPNFNGPQEAGDALVDIGFDVVNIATNHMLDMRTNGLESTIAYWKTKDVLLIGGYENKEDYNNFRIYETDGIKIAFLAYTYGTNGMTLSAGSELVIPLFDENTIRSQVTAAKQAADLVFVSCHWGLEDNFAPSAEQEKYAQIMADCGADVIIGHHPHVVQPVKWLTGESGNKTLAVYSLGNLISTMLYGRNMVGGIITFDIVNNEGEKPYIENPVFVPTITHYDMTRFNLQVYLLEHYTPELAAAHGCLKNSSDFSVDRAKQYITDTIDAEFLPDYLK